MRITLPHYITCRNNGKLLLKALTSFVLSSMVLPWLSPAASNQKTPRMAHSQAGRK